MAERSESDAAADDQTSVPEADAVVPNRRDRRHGAKAEQTVGQTPIGKPRGSVVNQRQYANRKHG